MATDPHPSGPSEPPSPDPTVRILRVCLRVAVAVAATALATLGTLSADLPGARTVVIAAVAAVAAQFGATGVPQAHRTIYLGWGEAALIVVAYLIPAGWAVAVMGAGALAGHCLYRLRTGTPLRWRVLSNAANLTLASAAGIAVAGVIGGDLVRQPHTLPIIGLVAGAAVYSLVATVLVHLGHARSTRDLAASAARTLRRKLPMIVGNLAIGVVFVLVFGNNFTWLVAMPALLVLTYQTYLFRSRISEERRLWREFTEVARSLNRTDERDVGRAAVAGVLTVFDAQAVEMWVERTGRRPQGYRGERGPTGITVTDLIEDAAAAAGGGSAGPPPPGGSARGPDMVHALAIGTRHVGDLRVWMPPGPVPRQRDRTVMAALGETIAGALHDASAVRAVHALTERGLHQEGYDSLTGIPNATALARTGDAVLAALPAGRTVALLVLGINRFKEVNDSLGLLAGDDLLREVARRLVAVARPGEQVARLAGDTFAVLMADAEPSGDAVERARGIAAHVAVPVRLGDVQVAVEASIGVACGPAGEVGVNELMRRADIAMHRAKRGAGPVAEYGTDPADAAAGDPERLFAALEMREAIAAGDQLVLDIVPVLDLDTGAPQRVEALVWWRHPRRGRLGAAEFADIVDTGDLAGAFARSIIDKALALRGRWFEHGLDLAVSVNVPPRSLIDPDLPADVRALLGVHGVPPMRLVLEITESAVPDGRRTVDRVLRALREHGVQIAVDNFGTGNATLSMLTRVQVDEVKVDESFVAAMTSSPEAAAIVRIGIDLGRQLGVRVVATGVQTAAQRAALRALGCAAGQGPHLMAPADPDSALALLHELAATATPDRPFPIV